MQEETFEGRRIVAFESRRAAEMASLIERYGGVSVRAPALREVRLEGESAPARAFAEALVAGSLDVVVLLTGVGTRALVAEVAPFLPQEALLEALHRTRVVVRGPKPAAALRELGFRSFEEARLPSTWREVVALLALRGGERVAIQQYGAPSVELIGALEAQGASVQAVPVYKWSLPEDLAPLRAGIAELARRSADVALFTSRAQVEHLALVAAEEGVLDRLRASFREGVVVASVGPVCSVALRAEGFEVDIEPENPKMGPLVRDAARGWKEALAKKTAS